MTLVAGIDIGGTKTAAALVTADGQLVRRTELPTPAAAGPRAVLDAAAEAVTRLEAGGAGLVAVGVGSAGVIDPVDGTVRSATDAMPGWAGTALRAGLAERLGVPVAADNDVNAHAVGEAWRGAAGGQSTVLVVAAGTGIGACVLLGGRVHHGAHGVAGEAGHLPVPGAAGLPCTCGGLGHVEAVASGPAMTAAYRARTGSPDARLSDIARLAADGEAEAVAVLRAGASALGEMIGGVANLLDPDLVLVCGGVSRCGDLWWDGLRASASAHLLPPLASTPIVPGLLGNDAALYGAARLAWLMTADRVPRSTMAR
ncbi:ROK family protein [Streptomyces sp. CWNU-52B]|uniref:ROK family protein n=1 Tax=unclassified Streptomyces TaxID=2593676 RepID=UPI0039BEE4B2